ncbi:uncharacterized protein AMSG_07424 [Thecamonas trahens ATCC 50062]|uniref:t-SNARE coiled-coil homology domain-containing protein n=1 Tax=Thecamonas trahens ATCC 50062 TaxID=461836 RepID=A0A0L0DGS3_THETB|nr:hypothetical protein AMSG_07424 [Thecamonas trahens ATCC 50062]KNC51527.1 hypothetical protein AMSG_07424 [Thecamonas trahens ATCC 50062]|eukprot:XP_013755930.1 hypothetical protein AMSG_07424 [Thecamonas trahens ATCC 50062]
MWKQGSTPAPTPEERSFLDPRLLVTGRMPPPMALYLQAQRSAAESLDIGAETLAELHAQRAVLARAARNLDRIDEHTHESRRLLNTIGSWFGGIKNMFVRRRKPLARPDRPPLATIDPIASPAGSTRAAAGSSHQAPLGTSAGTADDDLDSLAASIAGMKAMALEMNTELDDQNKLLDDIAYGVDAVSPKIRNCTRRAIRYT